jgi:hypothetical protein
LTSNKTGQSAWTALSIDEKAYVKSLREKADVLKGRGFSRAIKLSIAELNLSLSGIIFQA